MIFGRITISQSHDASAADVARNMDLDIAEVLRAYEHDEYSDYANA
jgi:hypothetical protein